MNSLRPADNPFSSHRVESLRYRSDKTGLPDLQRRLDDLGGRAAIVGPKGSGKTTLLEEIASSLPPPVAWVRMPGSCPDPWNAVQQQLPQFVSGRHAILLDGSEQLGPLDWNRLRWRARNCRRLIATLHKPGRLPTLIECRTDPILLRDLVGELAPQRLADLAPALNSLFDRHQGNLRLCFRELYDLFAGRSHVNSSGSSS